MYTPSLSIPCKKKVKVCTRFIFRCSWQVLPQTNNFVVIRKRVDFGMGDDNPLRHVLFFDKKGNPKMGCDRDKEAGQVRRLEAICRLLVESRLVNLRLL